MTPSSAPQIIQKQFSTFENSNNAVFPVKGQGTVSVTTTQNTPFSITIADPNDSNNALILWIEQDKVRLSYQDTILAETSQRDIGLNPEHEIQPYWLSLDSNNGRVRYGKGEMLRALMLFEYSWPISNDGITIPEGDLSPQTKLMNQIQINNTTVNALQVLPIPVNLDPSPYIVPSAEVSLEKLSDNSVTVIADLPNACQRLYANVAGPSINLQPADFPDFAEAIQYSIITPNALCYNKLAEKDPIFGYLRITIDPNLGDSPGQPYVLEIWPAGNGSPIHDHGDACAVIKVLHGQIHVSWYAALSPQISQPWGSVTLSAGAVTFLTPDYYQIHQLQNPLPKGSEFCATIQCYRYEDSNTTHYEYFDYIEDDEIRRFDPDSDWTYLEFKRLIQEEWLAAQRTLGPVGSSRISFRDNPPVNGELINITLWGGDVLDAIQCTYTTGQMDKHGGSGGQAFSFDLADGEYMVEVSGQYGNYFGEMCICQLQIRTNQRTLPAIGSTANTSQLEYFVFAAHPNAAIVSFFGDSSRYINGLGVKSNAR